MFSHQLLLGHEIQENEMRGAHDAYMGEEKCIQSFGRETWRKDTTWKLWEYTTLKHILKKKDDTGVDWNDPAQSRDVVGCCEQGNELMNSIKRRELLWTSLGTTSFSRMTLLKGVSVVSQSVNQAVGQNGTFAYISCFRGLHGLRLHLPTLIQQIRFIKIFIIKGIQKKNKTASLTREMNKPTATSLGRKSCPLCQHRLVQREKVMGLDAGSESRPITATFEYNVSVLLISLSWFYILKENK